MSDVTIAVEHLSKLYRIGGTKEPYGTLHDSLVSAFKTGFGMLNRSSRTTHDFWALRDLTFDVTEGQVLGVIGRNGAGKSTLLKILSRITEPTDGQVAIQGRVGSLLEVGTGFHPELTGRENIYLSGIILGMKRREIDARFDEIVEFAEIQEFLETPVKRYSSGMYVRLAFAVAAHLEPEILFVDEVLSVGDAAFQKKCLGKMGDVARAGRTILFVSHNMNVIQRLCSKCLLLKDGRISAFGTTADVVSKYLASDQLDAAPATRMDATHLSHQGTGQVHVTALSYCSDDTSLHLRPYPNGPLEFTLDLFSNNSRTLGSIAITIYDKFGTKLVNLDTLALGETLYLVEGNNTVRLRIKELNLNPGEYVVGWWLSDPLGELYDFVESAFNLEVVEQQVDRQFGVRPVSDGVVTCAFEVARLN